MRIKYLIIDNFRNIESMCFTPGPGANVIYGNNAQGKTNLLEAAWLFSGAKSFRGAKDSEFIKFNEQIASLKLEFHADERPQTAAITFSADKKLVLLNEIKQDSVTKLAGEFCTVVFSPDHLSLVKQGPERRRKLIDTSLCQAYPKYIKVLEGYAKTLKQRNTLLKDLHGHPSLLDTLEIWDKNLLDYGSYITAMRGRYVKKLAQYAKQIYDGISSGKEDFTATYQPSFGGTTDGFEKQDYREKLEQAIQKSRADDIRLGTTTMGPHRDDMEISVGGMSARAFGSQGQQRSCILALKLAECGILEESNKEPPVVLLDDVMSELDETRRSYLLNQLQGRQVLITCCNASSFGALEGGNVVEINSGRLL